MKIALVKHLVDVGLDKLIGAVAGDGNGGTYYTLINPNDVRLRSVVLVYEPGDVIVRGDTCPPHLAYIFDKSPDKTHIVRPRDFHGKHSPTLFCTLSY